MCKGRGSERAVVEGKRREREECVMVMLEGEEGEKGDQKER